MQKLEVFTILYILYFSSIVNFYFQFVPFQDCPKPIVAAIMGSCLGGGLEVLLSTTRIEHTQSMKGKEDRQVRQTDKAEQKKEETERKDGVKEQKTYKQKMRSD